MDIRGFRPWDIPPFFEKRGFRVPRPRRVERRSQVLTNYVMEKELM